MLVWRHLWILSTNIFLSNFLLLFVVVGLPLLMHLYQHIFTKELFVYFFHSLSLSHTHTHLHKYSLTLSLTHTHTFTHFLTLSLSHTHTLTHILTLSHTHTLTHTYTYTHSLSLSHKHKQTYTFSPPFTHPLSSVSSVVKTQACGILKALWWHFYKNICVKLRQKWS